MEKRIMDLLTNGFQDSGWKSDIDKQRGVDVCINSRGKIIKSCEQGCLYNWYYDAIEIQSKTKDS